VAAVGGLFEVVGEAGESGAPEGPRPGLVPEPLRARERAPS